MAPYLAAYFQDASTGSSSPDDQRLYWATSADGNAFNPAGRIATNGSVRDPSILPPSQAPDGSWHVACTNHSLTSTIPNNTVDVYAGNTFAGLDPAPQHVDCSAMKTSGTVNWAWAPEWFKDSDGTIYLMISTSTSGQSVDLASFVMWAIPATNSALTAWGTPVKMTGMPVGGIDAYVVKIGGTYYGFVKAGTIQMYTAPSFPAGPWSLSAVNPVPDFAPTAGEAPNVTNMGGGVRRLYYDQWNEDGKLKYTVSADNFASFSNSTYVVCPDRMRHASIIDVAAEPPLKMVATGGRRAQVAA